MARIICNLPALHPGQQQMHAARRRFNIACMGRRFGKTKFGVREMALDGIDGKPVAWFAPTYKLLDEVWRETVARLHPIIKDKNKSEKRIELLTGGSIDFWTLDGDDPARGRKYFRVFVDEAAMVRDLLTKWQASIRPTLTDYSGGAWFFSTPKGMNDFSTMYTKAGLNPSEWGRWQMPTWTNPHIDPAEIESARLELPELIFRQEYGAEFVDFAGSVVRREFLRYSEPPRREDMDISMGVDLALGLKQTNDYTACGVMGRERYGQQRTFVLDVQRDRMGFHDSMNFVRSMAEKWGPSIIAMEEVQYQAAAVQEILHRTSLPAQGVKPDRDKLRRFQGLRARYEQMMIYHAPNLLPDYEAELLAFPNSTHDDQIDATTYAFMYLPESHGIQIQRIGHAAEEVQHVVHLNSDFGAIRADNGIRGFV